MDQHIYEPASGHGLRHDPFNAIVGPRPIGWIASQDKQGRANLAPYSFFNAFCYKPPLIGFASTTLKDTLSNIRETGEFTWNLATMELREHMNATAAHVSHETSEFDLAKLTKAPGRVVKAPRVAEARVSFECRMTEIMRLKRADGGEAEAWLTIGEVVCVYIDKTLIKDGVYQTAEARPILRAGRAGDYVEVRPDAMFEMIRPD